MARKNALLEKKDCIQEMIRGIACVYPGLSSFPDEGIVFLNEFRGNKVGILSGGGSGHEPFPIGFIADNMITGSVSGPIFTSPPTQNIYKAICVLNAFSKGGILVIVLNYTGDQLNFGLAIERAKNKGIEVEKITISDDVALIGTDNAAIIGNRGICGCAFIFKLLGAMSNEDKNLHELVSAYKQISQSVASMGACFVSCRHPKTQELLFDLKEDEVSVGCGVHGEAGIYKVKMTNIEDMVAKVLEKIFESEVIKSEDKVCVLVGNLGSLTPIECFIIANVTQAQLEKRKIKIERMYVGTVMSSLDMKGFQISVLNVNLKESWLRYLDSPTTAYGWPGTCYSYAVHKPVDYTNKSISFLEAEEQQKGDQSNIQVQQKMDGPILKESESKVFKIAVTAACEAIKANAEKLNELDAGCGDGDCGTTMAFFADAILAQKDALPWKYAGSCFLNFSRIAEAEMGGTSGAVYSLLFAGAAKGISRSWQEAWLSALKTLYEHSPARVGHRTLIDALAPACDEFCSCIGTGQSGWKVCLKQAIAAANTGCQNTASMKPKVGRAAYTAPNMLRNFDAGAFAVTILLQAIYQAVEKI